MTTLALAYLLHACAPNVHPQTLAAIVQVESGGWPWAINDNTTKESRDLADYRTAVAVATDLLARGHNVDLGLAQINSGNLRGLGLNVAQAFQPCENLAAGARILTRAFVGAEEHFGPRLAHANPRFLLPYALSAYNTGSMFAGASYVRKVVAASESPQVWRTALVSLSLSQGARASLPVDNRAPRQEVPWVR